MSIRSGLSSKSRSTEYFSCEDYEDDLASNLSQSLTNTSSSAAFWTPLATTDDEYESDNAATPVPPIHFDDHSATEEEEEDNNCQTPLLPQTLEEEHLEPQLQSEAKVPVAENYDKIEAEKEKLGQNSTDPDEIVVVVTDDDDDEDDTLVPDEDKPSLR